MRVEYNKRHTDMQAKTNASWRSGQKQLPLNFEYDLYPIWERFCRNRLPSADGRLRGIYAGRLNRFDGPDYQGAEIEYCGRIYRGDIEIHREVQDWERHGHHHDRRYDGVVLHLVSRSSADGPPPVRNSKHRIIPTLNIHTLEENLASVSDGHCPVESLAYSGATAARLRRLALKRLNEKARRLHELQQHSGADQALYQKMLRVVFAGPNAAAGEQLAVKLSWEKIREIKAVWGAGREDWQAILFGTAGMPRSSTSGALYQRWSSILQLPQMPPGCWQRGGQRPVQRPEARLQWLVRFLHGLKAHGLQLLFRDIFSARLELKPILRELGQRLQNPGKALLIELCGNVLLPFFYHEALAKSSFGFAAYLEEIYCSLPSENRYGVLRRFRLHHEMPKRFFLQQALLQLVHFYCDQSLCRICPLNQSENH